MPGPLRAVLVACGIALALAQHPSAAQAVPPAAWSATEEQAIGSVVREQLEALAADDASRAFSYATPEIRAMFRTPETFIAMVRAGYAAVVRPRSTLFFKPERRDDAAAALRVQLVDRQGAAWVATYRLERQANGLWRIAGCELQPSRGQVV